MFDGSTETFEMLKRPDTVQVIPIAGDKILLAHQEQPTKPRFYSFFGGRVDEGEEPLAAAKRELLEESGYTSDSWELYKIYEPYSKFDWRIYYFFARNCQRVTEAKLDAGERIDIIELSFEEFIKLVIAEDFHGGEFANDLLRLRLDPKKLRAFRRRLTLNRHFGQ